MDDFYAAYWEEHQDLPYILWEAESATEIARVMEIHIRVLLDCTAGINGSTFVVAQTLRSWTTTFLYVAFHNIIGPGSTRIQAR